MINTNFFSYKLSLHKRIEAFNIGTTIVTNPILLMKPNGDNIFGPNYLPNFKRYVIYVYKDGKLVEGEN